MTTREYNDYVNLHSNEGKSNKTKGHAFCMINLQLYCTTHLHFGLLVFEMGKAEKHNKRHINQQHLHLDKIQKYIQENQATINQSRANAHFYIKQDHFLMNLICSPLT
jgi:hypothetical protein